MNRFIKVAAVIFIITQAIYSRGEKFSVANHQGKEKLYIVVIGDQGKNSQTQKNVAGAIFNFCSSDRIVPRCDFVIGLGDNIYPKGARSWRSHIFNTHFESIYSQFENIEFWLTLGNHDHRKSARAQIDYTYYGQSPRWRMPDFNYEIPNLPKWIKIVTFDSDPVYNLETNNNLEEAIELICQPSSEVKWKMMFAHHPLYSSRFDDDGRAVPFQSKMKEVFDVCEIDFYLAGHDHFQSHQSITMKKDRQNTHLVIQGAAGEVNGVGGKVSYPRPDYHNEYFNEIQAGFAVLEVSKEQVKILYINEKAEIIHEYIVNHEDAI